MSNRNQAYKLALGSAQFGMPYGIANTRGKISQIEVIKILDLARKNNIDTIDTAKNYGDSESSIGKYVKRYPDFNWKIITKIASNNDSIIKQITDSVEKLNVLPNVVMAHNAKLYINKKFQIELKEILRKFNLKIGVSVYDETDINQVLNSDLKPDVIQVPMNILDTALYQKKIISKLYQQNIEIHVRSVFLQGLFYLDDSVLKKQFSDVVPYIKKLRLIAKNANLTISELSLLWVASLDQISKIVIGVDSLYQLKSHFSTLNKNINNIFFEEALNINYNNSNITNPSLWKKVLAIIQARMGSTRLPGKVLKKINNISLIEILLKRLEKSRLINKTIIATSTNKENDELVSAVRRLGIEVFRGSENDVLRRYYDAAKLYNFNTIVRITGDCPIIDPNIVDDVISLYQKSNVDYASNTEPPTFPDGLDVEVFSLNALKGHTKTLINQLIGNMSLNTLEQVMIF